MYPLFAPPLGQASQVPAVGVKYLTLQLGFGLLRKQAGIYKGNAVLISRICRIGASLPTS